MKQALMMTHSAMDGVFIESADIDIADGENFAFVKKVIPDVLFSSETGTNRLHLP